ncbi:hypothetical protein [Chromobacterium haemolyticum]|uniref:hypothetical protein n=1 Tax=Chromobacterium haemolyticum TaxID=394935 RepID=UPI0013B3E107|nr:hypothetical protein [Chromobacterium haemolyticum]
MSLRDEYIKAGIIKPAGMVTEAVASRPRDVVGSVLPSDRPASLKETKKSSSLVKKSNKRDLSLLIHPKQKPLFCPLCGEKVAGGKLLEHKNLVHGERLHSPPPKRTAPLHIEKATFVRGGAPGLKKR